MSADIETYLQQGNVPCPWWGSNVRNVDDGATIAEIKAALGWDQDLILCPKRTMLPDGRFIVSKDCDVVRPSDWRIVGSSVSADYKIHQPGRCLDFFYPLADAMQCIFRRAGSLRQGSIIWALFQLDKDFTAPNGEQLLAYACVRTSFDRSTSTRVSPTSIDVQCKNTEMLFMRESKKLKSAIDLRHSTKLTDEVLKQAQQATGLCLSAFSAHTEFMDASLQVKLPAVAATLYAAWASEAKNDKSPIRLEIEKRMEQTDHTEAEVMLDLIDAAEGRARQNMIHTVDIHPWEEGAELSRSGADLLDRILRGPGADLRTGTAWALHSGLTDYVDHVSGRNADTALQSAWFGPGATLKQESQSLIAGMVSALKAGA